MHPAVQNPAARIEGADEYLEEHYLALLGRLEQKLAAPRARGALRSLERLAEIVNEIGAETSPGPDVRLRDEVLDRALGRARIEVPELVLVRQRQDRITLALATTVYTSWRDEPEDRSELFGALAAGLAKLAELLLRELATHFGSQASRKRFGETVDVFVSDLRALAKDLAL